MGMLLVLRFTQAKRKTGWRKIWERMGLKHWLCHTTIHTDIYFDNYFCSIQLLLDLLKCGLYGCGTIQTNRKGLPKHLKMVAKKGLGERGRSNTYQCGKLTATVWQDRKPVTVVATNSDPKTPT